MRHKLLDSIRTYVETRTVKGIVALDETFLSESFKGNIGKLCPKRHRGGEVKKRGISSE